MRFILTALLGALCLPGCAGMAANAARNTSASRLGCPNDQIAVSHLNYGPGTMSWEAECHGNVIVCSSISDPNTRAQVDCQPLDDGTKHRNSGGSKPQ